MEHILLKKMLDDSKSFDSITMKGCFSIGKDDFIMMYEYYVKTGENLLDDYANMVYLECDFKSCDYTFQVEEIKDYTKSFIKLYESNMFNSDWLMENIRMIQSILEKEKILLQIAYSKKSRRIKGNKHIGNSEVRKAIFNLYGEKCLCCGSEHNIQIDHVVPIAVGGKSEINNYQPLCKSCNSSKGTKIKDYRNGNI